MAKKRSKKTGMMTKVFVGLGALALAVGGFILYKRSKQPGLSTSGY